MRGTYGRGSVGRGVNQGGSRVARFVINSADPLDGLRLELPAWASALYIEHSPFARRECFLFLGAAPNIPRSAITEPDTIRDGLDVTQFRSVRLDDDVQEAFLWSTVEPGVAGHFVIVAIAGWLEDAPAGAGAASAVEISDPLVAPNGPVRVQPEIVPLDVLTQTAVAVDQTSDTLVVSEPTRSKGWIFNNGPDAIAVHFGAAAAVFGTDAILPAGQAMDLSFPDGRVFTGEVRAITDAGDAADVRIVTFEDA